MNKASFFSLSIADNPHHRSWLPLVLIVASFVLMFGPSWGLYLELGSDPYRFDGDIRTFVPSLYRLTDPSLFPGSDAVDYFANITPIGYLALFAMLNPWFDPMVSTKVVGAILYWLGVGILGAASARLSGWAGAWVSMALAFSVGPNISGLPHDFSWPILCGATAALLHGRVHWLAATALLGAAFYFTSGVIIGIVLFLWLFIWPKSDRGDAKEWSWNRRVVFLLITGLLFVAVSSKQIIGSRQYGPILTADYCQSYPEIGPKGRLGHSSVCVPLDPLLNTLKDLSLYTLTNAHVGEPFSYTLRISAKWALNKLGIHRDTLLISLLWVFILAGISLSLIREAAGRRLLIVLAAGLTCYYLARPYAPMLYLPDRYLEKTFPIFLLIAFPASFAGLFKLAQTRWHVTLLRHSLARPLFVVFVGCATLLLLGGRGNTVGGFSHNLNQFIPLMDYLRTLPKDVIIAGWPKGKLESIPLLAKRTILLSLETHVPYHKAYVDALRPKTYALIDAYFATTTQPLIDLRDRYAVTHLLVEIDRFSGNHFYHISPFAEYAKQKKQAGESQGFEILRQIPHAETFSMPGISVLDLRKLKVP
ncbi:MAG: hypothetical protein HQL74_09030 [Magnetococcales bacterium]|nr:hypothetical protein [Magnetococcales bacterium]